MRVAARLAVEIFRDENSRRVVLVADGRSPGENKLMRGEARPLIGLKHEVRPTILRDHRQVRGENSIRVLGARRIRDVAERAAILRRGGRAIHAALIRGYIEVALTFPARMTVVDSVFIGKRDRERFGHA